LVDPNLLLLTIAILRKTLLLDRLVLPLSLLEKLR